MSPGPLEICDPEGDIRLTVPLAIESGVEQQKCFIVSSKAMRLACDPWKKMLAPDSPFAEREKVGQGELSLPEDDAAPLAILLHIAHLNFDKIPQYMTFKDLLDLAVLTDKYGATKLVRPWIKSWICDVQHLLLMPAFEQWLWIAWEFGQIANFRRLAEHLVTEVRETADGRCITRSGRILDPLADSCRLPPDIIESILDVRRQVLQSLFDVFQPIIGKFTASDPYIKFCQNSHKNEASRRECELQTLTFASISLSIRQVGLSLEKSWVDEKDWSLAEITEKLLSIEGIPRRYPEGYIGSDVCANMAWRLRRAVERVLTTISSPVQDSHLHHLQRQAKACGLASRRRTV